MLSQKFYIGVEQADTRRFRANSWSDCGVIKVTQEEEAIATLEQLLQSQQQFNERTFISIQFLSKTDRVKDIALGRTQS